jgi:hypothetical protein
MHDFEPNDSSSAVVPRANGTIGGEVQAIVQVSWVNFGRQVTRAFN